MPLGVMRLRNVHASWVSQVGTNGRSLLTQPISAVAQAIGISGYSTNASNAHAQIAFSNSSCTDAQSTSWRLGITIASASEDAGEHADVHQAEALDLERRDVFHTGRGRKIGAQRLQRLALVPDALGQARRQRRRLNDWNDLAGSLLPERVDHRRDGAFVTHELRRQRRGGRRRPGRTSTAHRWRPQR